MQGRARSPLPHCYGFALAASSCIAALLSEGRRLDHGQCRWPSRAARMCRRDTRLVMDILSNSVFVAVPFALWAVLIGAAVYSLAGGGEEPCAPFRSSRDVLDEHLTRHDIGR